VALGSQIYACPHNLTARSPSPKHDVDAHLTDDIHHTFVRPLAGTPQWQAPDGSAVIGTVVTKTPTAPATSRAEPRRHPIGTPTRTARPRAAEVLASTQPRRRPGRPLRPAGPPDRQRPYQATTCSSTG